MQHSNRRRLAVVGCVAISSAALAAVALGGGAVSAPTTLKMRNAAPAFHGKVTSPVEECESDRRVKLFRERPNGTREVLGRTDSDFNGKWLILVDPLESGSYIAKAKRHIIGDDELVPTVCKPDFSPRIFVD